MLSSKKAQAGRGATKPLARLWGHLSPRRRRQFLWLLVLTVLASFSEVVSIGSVIPFLGVLTSPERVYEHAWAKPLIETLQITEPSGLVVPLACIFALTATLAGLVRLLLLWVSTRLSYAVGAELGIQMFRRTLYQDYSVHVSRNSSQVIDAITGKSQAVISGVIDPLLLMSSSSVILITVLAALLVYQPYIVLTAFFCFGLLYGLVFLLVRKRLSSNSRNIAASSTRRIKALQEGLGGIRDLLIDGTQETYCRIYQEADQSLRSAQAKNLFTTSSPRLLVETLGMVLIAGLVLFLSMQPGGTGRVIPLIGALAFCAQRLLPLMQYVYQGWANVRGNWHNLLDTLELLDQPLPDNSKASAIKPLRYAEGIRFQGVGFKYAANSPWILENINLTIPKGSRVGIIGPTGSGKSTLVDILMGLLSPTRGQILVDAVPVNAANQRSWQTHIAHVPQSIFLADATIEENIAFGVPSSVIDSERVRKAATQAQIDVTIQSWDKQYQTLVGERGMRLSGGQRQRIGIARALYKKADVIVLDEATSALDQKTESEVMASLEQLDRTLTIIIIAHRLSTLAGCDQIIEVKEGKVQVRISE